MSINFDDLEARQGFFVDREAQAGHVPARPDAATAPLHPHLGRRPPGRAAPHVRGPGAGAVRRPRPRCRARRDGHGVLALRRRSATTRSASTPWSAARRRAAASSRPASTRCAAARGTSTPASHDMDLNGVYASLNFPSSLAGFAGQRYQLGVSDPELALAVVRAANDWHLEEWAGRHPGPHHPGASCRGCSTRRSRRPRSAATPSAGFRAVTFPELPERLGLPSLHTGYWDPFMAGLRRDRHRGVPARRLVVERADDVVRRAGRHDRRAVLRLGHVRRRRLALLEAPGALPRPEDLPVRGRHRLGRRADRPARPRAALPGRCTARGSASTSRPREVLQRNFWFCTIDDPSGLEQRHRIGIDHLLLESDYPHQDGTWPDTQEILHEQIGHFPADDIRKLTWENASKLLRPPGARRRPGRPRGVLMTDVADATEDRHPLPHRRRRAASSTGRAATRNVGGHVSARADEGDGFWVTGFEYFDQTMPDGVAKLDFDLQPLVGASTTLSPAVNFHALIYRAAPRRNAIVHLHSHHVSVLSSIGAHGRHVQRRGRAVPRGAGDLLRRRREGAHRTWSTPSATSTWC